MDNRNALERCEIYARAVRQRLIDFDCVNMATGCDKRRQKSSVVACPSPDLDDSLARLGSDSTEKSGVEKRLSIVDTL
jgi:hypothetical protein